MKSISITTMGLLLSSCCAFVPCDRLVHVAGTVLDADKKPIQDAAVVFYGSTEKTDKNGCFYFGGALAASGFTVSVRKEGYKSYKEGKEFKYYDITVILEEEDSVKNSTGVWQEVKVIKPGDSNPCTGK